MCTTTIQQQEPINPKIHPTTTHIVTPPPPKPLVHQLLKVFIESFRLEYDYVELINEEKTIVKLHNKPCKINIILAVYRRDIYIKAAIRSLQHSICSSNLSINITIVQIEDIPTLQKYADMHEFDYIFLHIDDIKTNGSFSKALAYDIGFLLNNNSEITLFQDCDLIVTDDFFYALDKHYLDNLSWMQTFAKKSVIPINYEDTMEILNNNVPDDELTKFLNSKNPNLNIGRKQSELNYKTVTGGACGGSILIMNELYEDVGGMDPEICYGYGIEDALFWTKLVTVIKKIGRISTVHQTDFEYADHPYELYQYHLYHATLATTNLLYKRMSDMQMEFLRSRYLDKKSYVDMKREQFAENKQKIKEYFNG